MQYRSSVAAKKEAAAWREFACDYPEKVFSATSFPAKRSKLLKCVRDGRVLVPGCGPLGLLERDLLTLPRIEVMSSDICLEMLRRAKEQASHEKSMYLAADNRDLPFASGSFASVVSVNSVVPESRTDVFRMFEEFHRVLKPQGILIALLPAFEMSLEAVARWGADIKVDMAEHREFDTTGWQCFFTLEDIETTMGALEFRTLSVERLYFDSNDEVHHIRRVYADLLAGLAADVLCKAPLFEHLLVATR